MEIKKVKVAERLAEALREAGLPEMEAKARHGYYGDYTSPLAMPITRLVLDLRSAGKPELVDRAMSGEFDGD